MKLLCLSDTHNQHEFVFFPSEPHEADVLIHSGDATLGGTEAEVDQFLNWYSRMAQRYTKDGKAIFVAGNHDWCFQRQPEFARDMCDNYGIIYLQDKAVTIDGVKFYGSPWQPEFHNWAFNADNEQLKNAWRAIPDDVEVLITHGPPYNILDKNHHGDKCGCHHLANELFYRLNPKVHIFGHIHNGAGQLKINDTLFVNASILDDRYQRAAYPVMVEI